MPLFTVKHLLYTLGTILCLLPGSQAFAQKCLKAGDIVITGVNTDDNDEVTWYALTDLPAGTVLSFTDNGWTGTGFYPNEHFWDFTVTTLIPAGTLVDMTYGTKWTATLSAGAATVGSNYNPFGAANSGLSTSGDAILVFTGGTSAPAFITAVNTAGTSWQSGATSSNESALPPGLTNGLTARAYGASATGEYDNIQYGGGNISGSRNRILNAVYGGTWSGNNNRYTTLNASTLTVYTAFRSTAAGNWNATATWQIYNGSTYIAASANDYPTSSSESVSISHDVTYNAASDDTYLKDLTVNSGGIFKTASTIDRTLNLWGNLTVNGQVGSGSSADAIILNLMASSHTISGTPTGSGLSMGRIRNGCPLISTTAVTISAPVDLYYGSATLYNNLDATTFNVTVSAGKTVKSKKVSGSGGDIAIDGVNGLGTATRKGTLDISGTLQAEGDFYLKTNNASGNNISVIVRTGGTLNIGDQLIGNTGSGPSVATITLENNALLELSGREGGAPDTDPVIFISATLNTMSFNAGSTVKYSRAGAALVDNFQNTSYGNLVIDGSGTKELQQAIKVLTSLTIDDGTALDAGSSGNYTITMDAADWKDNNISAAGFIPRAGKVSFDNGASTVQDAYDYTNFYTLEVKASTLTLLSAVSASKQLLFTGAGKVMTDNTNILKLKDGCTVSPAGGSSTQFVDGPMQWEEFGTADLLFPVGKGTVLGNCSVEPRQADSRGTASRLYQAEYFPAGYGSYAIDNTQSPPLDHVSAVEYWDISEESGAGSADKECLVGLKWRTLSKVAPSSPERLDLRVAHWNASISKWEMVGNNPTITDGGTSDGKVKADNYISSFSPFTLASIITLNPLPVHLLSFDASCSGNKAHYINWKVTDEQDIASYILEYGSDDTFKPVFTTEALNQPVSEYSYTNYTGKAEKPSFYRLSTADFSGHVNVEYIVSAPYNCGVAPAAVCYAGEEIYVDHIEPKTIHFYNALGQDLSHLVKTEDNKVVVPATSMQAGIYLLEINGLTYKIVI